jgi:hypothetical protein
VTEPRSYADMGGQTQLRISASPTRGPTWAEGEVRTPKRPRWHVTCSCGWEREASSAWAASAILRLHVQHLGDPTIEHTVTIEEPPTDAPPGTQLPLT